MASVELDCIRNAVRLLLTESSTDFTSNLQFQNPVFFLQFASISALYNTRTAAKTLERLMFLYPEPHSRATYCALIYILAFHFQPSSHRDSVVNLTALRGATAQLENVQHLIEWLRLRHRVY